MSDPRSSYCDVALPVPVDKLFTYHLPEPTRRVLPGCRVIVPFGSRKLTGVVLRLHDEGSPDDTRDVLSLRDEEPVLGSELLRLGLWIADYYCAPVGEVFRGMLPLSGETRRGVTYTLSDLGRDAARQLVFTSESDPASRVLSALQDRPLSSDYLVSKIANSRNAIRSLIKRGWIVAEDYEANRDPFRAPAERLQAEFHQRPPADLKLNKGERELISFLELHPGAHNLVQLSASVKNARIAARALARKGLILLRAEQSPAPSGFDKPVPTLNSHQATASDAIAGAITEGTFHAFLLQGVTGSGKTEVYLRAIEKALAQGRNALLLVPEIGLTPAVAGQFFHRFGDQVAILHSAFGDSERAGQWRRIQAGKARVVVGTRSSVFAPVQNLGLVVIDEEHDGSYKQAETPRYNGRDVAIMRAKNTGAAVVLGSATPSIESRFNAEQGKYTLLRLPERIAQRPMPEVRIIDMRTEFLETKKQATFSRELLSELKQRLANGEQSMLLLNRRGFSSFMVCRACGERLPCANCSVALTHHRRDRRMLCHYCGYAEKIPKECPKCGSEYIQFLGIGSERIEDELHQHLPNARIARLDRDTAAGKRAYEHILQGFREGATDILVGTQMIAKGHDIPNVTLVGIVLADIGLGMPDFRAAERTFQLLTQAAGRSGRGETAGRVIIQTLTPEHYAIQFAAAQDYEGFYKKETEFRRWLRYPPFAAFANIVVRAEKQEEALCMVTELGRVLIPVPEGARIMGPAEAPVARLMNEFRYQILLKASKRSTLKAVISDVRHFAEKEKWKATALVIDVDPISLM